jgi:hypothetical protein
MEYYGNKKRWYSSARMADFNIILNHDLAKNARRSEVIFLMACMQSLNVSGQQLRHKIRNAARMALRRLEARKRHVRIQHVQLGWTKFRGLIWRGKHLLLFKEIMFVSCEFYFLNTPTNFRLLRHATHAYWKHESTIFETSLQIQVVIQVSILRYTYWATEAY